ncbi:hypothetical protein OJ996_20500 [Luteolibacter sp. GHJ8]|uniref:DNA 5'-3' helicase n=1 Tax=Luteolibacter rhizosphaerae TaxID=2989719 RepID=A0ABT3G9V1_9BACT|nr:DnaB-like helicase C-terminal domain-containing protein [Luteolibacter rhizosphaerae]MCW1915980.1 hypothetical protein [Luteolibacter rhizosphaerae]
MPHLPLVERSVLSLMIRDDRFRRRALGEGLKAEHFWSLRPLWEAIAALARSGHPVDVATLSTFLARDGRILEIGGHEALQAIAEQSVPGDNWTQWVRDLGSARARRVAVESAKWMAEAADGEEALEAAAAAEKAIKEAIAGPTRAKPMKQVMAEVLAELQDLVNAGPLPGVPTGIDELDAISGGMRAGELWVILAQTSGGKSVLMNQLGLSGLKAKKRGAFFSVEMLAGVVGARLISSHGVIPLEKLTQPKTNTKRDWNLIEAQMKELAAMEAWVDDTPKMSLSHVEAEAQRLTDAHGPLGIIVVDYIQILKGERAKNSNREEVVAMISSGLKQLAKAMKCPVVTGAQVNRSMIVRESDAISFDADAMLMIADDGIKVAKMRNGRKNDILRYRLNGQYQRFERISQREIDALEKAEKEAADEAADKAVASRGYGAGRNKQFK